MKKTLLLALVCLTFGTSTLFAQHDLQTSPLGTAAEDPFVEGGAVASIAKMNECEGIVYDDGSFENGYKPSALGADPSLVMRFTLPQAAQLSNLCVCFAAVETLPQTTFYDLSIFADNNGQPGAELHRSPGWSASGITLSRTMFRHDLSAQNIILPAGSYFFGVTSWVELDNVFLCADESTTTPFQPAFMKSLSNTFTRLEASAENYRALGIRADTEQANGCIPSDDTLCLQNGRFSIKVDWSAGGNSGSGTSVNETEGAGMFWFFDQNNIEMLIKVLNGCSINGNYWVLFAATTDVGFTVTVEDTETGQIATYTNEAGNKANAVIDTEALAVCP